MRSKMLGLAIALSTFGLGVAATTVWIAQRTPSVPTPFHSMTRTYDSAKDSAPCFNSDSSAPPRVGSMTIPGGILNGKAISKSTPAYPPTARAAQESGPVIVMVTVNECGNVADAKMVSGTTLLGQAAEEAARKWRFSPMFISGRPVAVKGTITFNFVLE